MQPSDQLRNPNPTKHCLFLSLKSPFPKQTLNPACPSPFSNKSKKMDPSFHIPTTIPSPSIPGGAPWMDCRIWSRLPHRLIDRVVASLPPPAFFRARSVCKRWYGLIFSTAFIELYLHLSPSRHWFIFFKHTRLKNCIAAGGGEAFLFDPENLKWYRLGIPQIPAGVSAVSASGGLVCFVSEEAGSKSVLLFNPVMGTLIQLPSTLRPRLCPSIGLTITDSSIDLIFAGDDLISPYAVKNLTSESFHIDGGGFYSIWGTTAALPRLCSLESGRMVHVKGRFYCMNYSPFSVLAYDVAANNWSKIQAPMRRFLRSPSLVESRGRAVLVAAVEKRKLNVPRSLRLWALQECGAAWAEIERMPQQLYGEFAEAEWGRGFDAVAHGDYVVILIKGSERAVMFDFGGKRWSWICPCPCGGRDGMRGFAYEPRLAVPITALLEQLTLPFNSFAA